MSSNVRHHLLSLWLLVGVAAPWDSHAQAPISSVDSGSVENRVTQLERISNARGQLLTQFHQKLSDSQADIDKLRGQIQENQYQLNQIVENQKQILLQMNSLSNGGATAAASQAGSASSRPDGSASAAFGSNAAPTSAPVQGGDANSDYNAAFALVQDKSRHDDAIVAFQHFVKKYPDSTYQPNANYWLGQLNYNKGKKDDAAYYYAYVAKNYPKSPKAPDAMYKVGIIMQEKGDKDKAKAVYQQVVANYPGTDGAKQARKKLAAMQLRQA